MEPGDSFFQHDISVIVIDNQDGVAIIQLLHDFVGQLGPFLFVHFHVISPKKCLKHLLNQLLNIKKDRAANWGEPRGLYKGYNMGSVFILLSTRKTHWDNFNHDARKRIILRTIQHPTTVWCSRAVGDP